MTREEQKRRESVCSIKKLIGQKKSCLKDFGVCQQVIDTTFAERNVTTVRQIDLVGDEILHNYFYGLEIVDAAKKVLACR